MSLTALRKRKRHREGERERNIEEVIKRERELNIIIINVVIHFNHF